MKNNTSLNRNRQFIKTPKLIGGNRSFKKIITDNLKYPKEALEKSIEGTVFLKFQVNNLGKVFDITVEKGIGYGCDEEAIRLIGLLKYEKVKNRGLNVISTLKVKINFKIAQKKTVLNYQLIKDIDKSQGKIYDYKLPF